MMAPPALDSVEGVQAGERARDDRAAVREAQSWRRWKSRGLEPSRRAKLPRRTRWTGQPRLTLRDSGRAPSRDNLRREPVEMPGNRDHLEHRYTRRPFGGG